MANITCIVCPIGCKLEVTKLDDIYKVEGNNCKKGGKYGVDELINPKRIITTTVKLSDSYLNLLPVKTSDSVPKGIIFDIMRELDKVRVYAPISLGDIIVKNILNTGVNIISCKTIEIFCD